jgi:tetratricopeptide (TPR) repeat protein
VLLVLDFGFVEMFSRFFRRNLAGFNVWPQKSKINGGMEGWHGLQHEWAGSRLVGRVVGAVNLASGLQFPLRSYVWGMEMLDAGQEVQRAVLEFSMGDADAALQRLDALLTSKGGNFDALLAKAEVLHAVGRFADALAAAEAALVMSPDDLLLQTTLSRIWMQLGDKEKAESFGARARLLGWKQQLAEG